jgi:hypothetical protein
MPRKKRRDDFDNPWKEILHAYFEPFLWFFFPQIAAEIDWPKGYVSLDKELRHIIRDAAIGACLADYLVKVWKKDGAEQWVLVHIEVQAHAESDFAHRIYVYNYRIQDLHHRPVASFAILADENSAWRPSGYTQELWGCRTEFRFPVVKILDAAARVQNPAEWSNPFAIVVLAHLKTLETKKDQQQRWYWKFQLTKELYQHGFSKTDILTLYRFIDWIMALPKELEETCHQAIYKFEEELAMPYITYAERSGIEKGKQEGRKEGMLIMKILFAQQALNRDIYSQEELEQKNLKDLEAILESLSTKLPPAKP